MKHNLYRRAYCNFRAKQNGNWNDYKTWEVQNILGNWVSTPYYPKGGNPVVTTGFSVSMTQNESAYSITGSVNLNGYTLTITGLEPETIAWLNSLSQQPRFKWKIAVNNAIKSQKTSGNYTKFTRFNLFCNTSEEAAKKCIKSLSNFTNNGVAWDFYGFRGNGTSGYIDTGINLSTIGLSNSNYLIGMYQENETAISNAALFGVKSASDDGVFLNPRTAANQVQARGNSTLTTSGSPTSTVGLNCLVRAISTQFTVTRNNTTILTSVKNANAFVNDNLYLFSSKNNGVAGNFSSALGSIFILAPSDIDQASVVSMRNQYMLDSYDAISQDMIEDLNDRIVMAGGSLNTTEYNSTKQFYYDTYAGNLGYELLDVSHILGSSLASAMQKGKTYPGLATSLTNNNLVSGDYIRNKGIVLTSNTNKWLDPNITPTSIGLSKNEFCEFAFFPQSTLLPSNSNAIVGLNNTGGSDEPEVRLGYLNGVGAAVNCEEWCGFAGIMCVNIKAGNSTPWYEGLKLMDPSVSPSAAAFNTPLTYFKSTRLGVVRYSPGSLGFACTMRGLTDAQVLAFNAILDKYLIALGRKPAGIIEYVFGDSTTKNSLATTIENSWPYRYAIATGHTIENYGVGGTRLRAVPGSVKKDFMDRYTEIANLKVGASYPNNKVHLGYLINDMTLDGDANGNATLIAARKAEYITAINYMIGTLGMNPSNIILVGPGGTTEHNNTKRAAYSAILSDIKTATGCKIFDLNAYFLSQGTISNFLADTLHPGDGTNSVLDGQALYLYAHLNAS